MNYWIRGQKMVRGNWLSEILSGQGLGMIAIKITRVLNILLILNRRKIAKIVADVSQN